MNPRSTIEATLKEYNQELGYFDLKTAVNTKIIAELLLDIRELLILNNPPQK